MRAFIFFLLSLPLLEASSCQAANLIQDTCKKASERSTKVNYNFCMTALLSDPGSPTADLAGLGIISVQLALANATETWTHIQELLKSEQFDPDENSCLEVCSEQYSLSISDLTNSLKALKGKRYTGVQVWLGDALTSADTCEYGFKKVKGHVSPLSEENYYQSQLILVAMSIVASLQ